MLEQRTTTPQTIEISNSPLSFEALIEETAKKLGLEIFGVEFDAVVSRTEDPDGTQHVTIKPALLIKASSLDRGINTDFFVLKGEDLAYAVMSKSWGGFITEDGDQTLYTNIAIYRLKEGTTPEGLRMVRDLGNPQMFYDNAQNWLGGGETDIVGSEKSRLRVAFVGHDPLFEEILSRSDKKGNPHTAQ